MNKKEELQLIQQAKDFLKKDKTTIELCKDNGFNINILDIIPCYFDNNLDVSAKTNKGIISLNSKLLENWKDNYHYLLHEITHVFQQLFSNGPTKSSDDGEYLENPYEVEAFNEQVKYLADNDGKNEAKTYVKDLLEYHDVAPNKKEKIKDKLLAKI